MIGFGRGNPRRIDTYTVTIPCQAPPVTKKVRITYLLVTFLDLISPKHHLM